MSSSTIGDNQGQVSRRRKVRRGPHSSKSTPLTLIAPQAAYSHVPSGPWQVPSTAPASRPTASARWAACPGSLTSPPAPSSASPAALARLGSRYAAAAKNRYSALAQPLIVHTYPPTLMLMPVRLRPHRPSLVPEPYPTHPTPPASPAQVVSLSPRCHDAPPRQPHPRSPGPLRPLQAAARVCRWPAMARASRPAWEARVGRAARHLRGVGRPCSRLARTAIGPSPADACNRPRGEPPAAQGRQKAVGRCPLAPLGTAVPPGPHR